MEAKDKVQTDQKKTGEATAENEIRVAVQGKVSSYLGYAFRILNKSDHKSLTIRATGNAIVKALILIELVKRRIGDLHQLNTIHSMSIEDELKPKGDNAESVKQVRRVTALDCVLSKEELDKTQVGYQEPVPREERTQIAPRKREKPANKDAKEPKDKDAAQGGSRKQNKKGHRQVKRYNAEEPSRDAPSTDAKNSDNKTGNKDGPSNPRGDSTRTPAERGNRGRGRGGPRGGRGRGRGGARRYNDDFDVQPSKRPRDNLDRPHQQQNPSRRGRGDHQAHPIESSRAASRRPDNHEQDDRADHESEHRERGPAAMRGLRGMRGQRGMRGERGMRGNRGRGNNYNDNNQDRPRREYGDRRHERNYDDKPPQIIERTEGEREDREERSERGGRGGRGGRSERVGYHDRGGHAERGGYSERGGRPERGGYHDREGHAERGGHHGERGGHAERGERGGRGGPMRGRGRGNGPDYNGGHHMRSRDDFHVAPPRYNNGDDFHGNPYHHEPRREPYYGGRGGGMRGSYRGGYNNYGQERSYDAQPLPYYNREQRGGRGGGEFRGGRGGGQGYNEDRGYGGPRPNGGDHMYPRNNHYDDHRQGGGHYNQEEVPYYGGDRGMRGSRGHYRGGRGGGYYGGHHHDGGFNEHDRRDRRPDHRSGDDDEREMRPTIIDGASRGRGAVRGRGDMQMRGRGRGDMGNRGGRGSFRGGQDMEERPAGNQEPHYNNE